MEKIKVLNQKAFEWLEKMPPNTWVRAFFSTFSKCDILLNNSCEVFNKYILDAREMPILSMLEQSQDTTDDNVSYKVQGCRDCVGWYYLPQDKEETS